MKFKKNQLHQNNSKYPFRNFKSEFCKISLVSHDLRLEAKSENKIKVG